MLTFFGVAALTFMMLMYALERRGPGFVLAFAVGCRLASLYGFLSGARREATHAPSKTSPIPSDPRSTLTGPRPPGGQL